MDEGEIELEISDDPYDCSRLDIKNVPVIVTLNKVRELTYYGITDDVYY